MLGVEALGVFALGQAEPWTLKGLSRRARGKTRAGDVEAEIVKTVRRRKHPPVSPEIRAMLAAQQIRKEVLRRDDEDAIAILLMTTH